jgi:hypothetical protein
MKRLLALPLLLAVVAIAPLFAYEDLPTRMEDVKLRKNTFDYLAKNTRFAATTTTYATPQTTNGTVASGTAYQGTIEPPFLMRVQNLGTTGRIFFKEYSSSSLGVATTSTTDAFLESKHANYLATSTHGQLAPGEVWEKVFYQDPNLTIGGAEAATFSIQLYTRPSQ